MTEIIPAVLVKHFDELARELARIQGVTKSVQVDVVDGVYAKHKTWPYTDQKSFTELVQSERGLPLWGELKFEFDVMAEHPEHDVESFITAGASQIVVHARSAGALEAFKLLVKLRDTAAGSVDTPITIGVALTCDAQPSDLEPVINELDYVQVMGIEHIGKQGEPLQKSALYLVERLRHLYHDLIIQVDGGVKLENVRALVSAGANRLVAGSAIFGTDDAEAAYKALYTEANAH